jgi:hypothetical protein
LNKRPIKSKGTGKGDRRPGESGDKQKKYTLGAKMKILTVDEKTSRDTKVSPK